MTQRVFCVLFMGQFGPIFSGGVYHLARVARSMGASAEVYSYTSGEDARRDIARHGGNLHLIAGVGYSLGVSALTELQRRIPFDLVFCVAGSSLGINYKINKQNTARSVLWKGSDILSSADNLGFDEVNVTTSWHLTALYDPRVEKSFRDELGILLDDDNKGATT